MKKILVATDFSEHSDRALEYALELAERLDATVTVVHVFEIPIYGFPDGVMVATADIASRITSAAEAGLKATVAKHARPTVELTSTLRSGSPSEEINALAEELNADLIVLGTHGRRGLARALLGSVADRVIRTATHPVLTLRADSAKKR